MQLPFVWRFVELSLLCRLSACTPQPINDSMDSAYSIFKYVSFRIQYSAFTFTFIFEERPRCALLSRIVLRIIQPPGIASQRDVPEPNCDGWHGLCSMHSRLFITITTTSTTNTYQMFYLNSLSHAFAHRPCGIITSFCIFSTAFASSIHIGNDAHTTGICMRN